MAPISAVQQGVGEIAYHARAKFRLRLLSTLCAAGALCSLAVAADQYSSIIVDEADHIRPGYVVELDIIAVILLSCSIAWDVTNLLYERVAHRSIHPGVRVALELLEWLGLIAVTIVMLGNTIAFYQQPLVPSIVTPIGLQYFGIAMMFMNCIPISILFVYACRETHLRRRNRREMAAMVLRKETEIESTPATTVTVPAPMIFACNCQEEIYGHLVAGAFNDQPPQYPAVAREAHAIEQGKVVATA